MGGAVSEEQVFPWHIGETGLTVPYSIVRWTGAAWNEEASGNMQERTGAFYEVKFTPANAGFWLALAYYMDGADKIPFGMAYFIGMGIEQAIYNLVKAGGAGDLAAILGDTNELQGDWTDGGRLDLILDEAATKTALAVIDEFHDVPTADTSNNLQMRDPIGNKADAAVETVGVVASIIAYVKGIINLVKNATYGLSALDAELEDIRQKATGPAWNQDTDSQEAIREAVDTRAPAGEYDTEMGTGERASAATLEDAMQKLTAPAFNQDTDSLEAISEAVQTRAPSSEYDTEMAHVDVDVSTRAPAGEYDTEMGTGERASMASQAVSMEKATAPDYDQDTDSQEAIRDSVDNLIVRAKGLDEIHDDLAAEVAREAGATIQGTYPHPSGTSEQVIVTLTITKRTLIKSALFDVVNLTKDTVFRAYVKVDGTNYRQLDHDLNWMTSDPDVVWFRNVEHDHDVEFRMQSVEAEGASRNVIYSIIKEEMEA